MAEPVYNPQGVPLREWEVAEAIGKGEARFDARRSYTMVKPGGEVVTVPGAEGWKALESGYQIESDAGREVREYKKTAGVGEAVKAFGEGAAESLTFGLSPGILAAEGLGGKGYAKRAELREEEFGLARGAGQVAGFLTPMAAEGLAARAGTGAFGVSARAAAKTITAPTRAVTGVSSRIGGLVERGLAKVGAPGAVRTGGRVAAESAFEGGIYNAGLALSEASLGDKELTAEQLLTAFGEGAGIGALVGGPLGAGGHLLAGGARKVAGVVGSKFAPKGGGSILEQFANAKALKAVGLYPGQLGKLAEKRGEAFVQKLGKRVLDEGVLGTGVVEAGTKSMAKRAKDLERLTQKTGRELGDLVKKVDDTGAKLDAAKLVNRIDTEVLGPLRASGFGADARIANRIEHDFTDALLDRATDPKAKPLTFTESRKLRRRIGHDAYRGEFGTQGDEALQKLTSAFEDEIEDQIGAVGGDIVKYKDLKNAYDELIKLSKASGKRAGFSQGLRDVSLTDTIMAGAGFVAGGGVGAVALGLLNKAARSTYADAAAAVVANKLAALPKVKAAQLAVATKMQQGVQSAVGSGATKLPTRKLPRGAPRLAVEFDRSREAVSGYAANRDGTNEATGQAMVPLSRVAPRTAGAVQTKRIGDLEYFATTMPRAPNADRDVPDSEKASWTRAVLAVTNPLGIIKALKDGAVTAGEIAAIKERRPAMYASLVGVAQAEIAKLAERGLRPDYQTRLTLAKLLGPELAASIEPTADPAFTADMQRMHAASRAASSPKPPPRGLTQVSTTRARDRSERFSTRSEQIASRG